MRRALKMIFSFMPKALVRIVDVAALAVALLLYGSVALSATTIAWTPASVSETLLPGETRTISVSFSSSTNIRKLGLLVTPELKPYVTMQPLVFQYIQGGEEYSVDISISAPEDALPGIVAGELKLRLKDRRRRRGAGTATTTVQSLPVVFQIEEPHDVLQNEIFEVSYPTSLIPSVPSTGKIQFSDTALPGDGDHRAPIRFFDLPFSMESMLTLIREQYFEGQYTEEIILVDGQAAVKISGSFDGFGWGGTHHTHVVIPQSDGTILQFDFNSANPEMAEVAEQMLSKLDVF